jgi:kinesin family protein 18/19
MIAAVSPSSVTLEDTYNTLKYADRAKNIKSNVRNLVNNNFVKMPILTHYFNR